MKSTNRLRAIRFERPDSIPMTFAVSPACWLSYPQDALCDLMRGHPYLFPDFVAPRLPYAPDLPAICDSKQNYTDDFGCVWHTAIDGILGTVVEHPLADWAKWDTFQFPDPAVSNGLGPIDWNAEAEKLQAQRRREGFASATLRHGHTFLQLSDLRGYQNLIYDMADEDERLVELIDRLTEFNLYAVRRYCAMGADIMGFPEDLGMQTGPMLSPAHLRAYIRPAYEKLMRVARGAGALVSMHSDGDIRTLADDLVGSGVQVLNLQDLVNGVDWIAKKYKGKLCVELDIDRQDVTVRGTPAQVDALIQSEVRALASPEGGLMMIYGLYPGTPLENVKAVMDAMEKYAFFFD